MLQSLGLLETREQIPPLRGTLQQKQIEGSVISLENTGEDDVNCLKKKEKECFTMSLDCRVFGAGSIFIQSLNKVPLPQGSFLGAVPVPWLLAHGQ